MKLKENKKRKKSRKSNESKLEDEFAFVTNKREAAAVQLQANGYFITVITLKFFQ